MLQLLAESPELSLQEVAETLDVNFKTAGEHMRRLAIAGLILKRNEGKAVRHALSPLGKAILKFLKTLE